MPIKRIKITPELLREWTEIVPVDSLKPHPQNANATDPERLERSVEAHGVYRAIVVSSDDFILAGNHTWAGAIKDGAKTITIHRLPIPHDHPQALEILLVDNPPPGAQKYDNGLLLDLLREVESTQGDFSATGFEQSDVDALLAQIEKDQKSTLDPDPTSDPADDNYREQYGVIVICQSEADQERVYNALEAEGYNCKVVTT